jgi:hypothetical protein
MNRKAGANWLVRLFLTSESLRFILDLSENLMQASAENIA